MSATPQRDETFHVEQRGTELIPEAQRHGRPWDLFPFWFGLNANVFFPITGFYLIAGLKLSFIQAIPTILVGNLLGYLLTGLGSIQGPSTGARAFVISRSSFGFNGNRGVSFLNWLQFIGFEASGVVLAVFAVQAIFQSFGITQTGTVVFVVIATIAIVAIQIVVPLFGHATILSVTKHYSCTCFEAEGGDRMEKLSSLERVHASLKFRRHLLQTGDGQVVGGAQVVLVAATMEVAMGLPAASPLPSLGVAVGGKAPVWPNEAEGGERGQPVKPLRRLWSEREGSLMRTDEHIEALCPIFDQGDHAGARSQFRRQEVPPWTRVGIGRAALLRLLQGWWSRTRSHRLLNQAFQCRQALFRGALAFAEQFQGQVGQVLLHGGHGSFQTSQALHEICRFRHADRPAMSGRKRLRLACQLRVDLLLQGNQCRGHIRKSWANGGSQRKRATMQCGQLLDLLLRLAVEACIRRMSGELHSGVSEPLA